MAMIADQLRLRGNKIGFVPTMGALHEGHMTLVRRSVQENDVTIVSIFVNPIQFNDQEDFERYPRDLETDSTMCDHESVDFIFAPEPSSMYQRGERFSSCWVEIQGPMTETLCGLSRPSHFRGVVTVCCKLFNIIRPHVAYFGQKDYQQYLSIKRLVADLNMPLEIELCPIVREQSGLALSSRNSRLTARGRQQASRIYAALEHGRKLIMTGEHDPNKVLEAMANDVLNAGLDMDYAIVADPESLDDVRSIDGPVLLAIAAVCEGVRLIDNELITSIPLRN
jgi:pantoate--beta-alanine ligase